VVDHLVSATDPREGTVSDDVGSVAIPAAWYPDPMDPTQLRWWDGAAWTISTAPDPAHAPPLSSPPPFQYEPTIVVPKQRPYSVVDYVPMATTEAARPAMSMDWTTTTRTGTNTVAIWFFTLMPLIVLGVTYGGSYLIAYAATVNDTLVSTLEFLTTVGAAVTVTYIGIIIVVYVLLAGSDRRVLIGRGYGNAPSRWFAVVPLLYLIVRVVRTGSSSIGYLVVWLVFQALSFVPSVISAISQIGSIGR
jgi:Protein of unknown function (DUF2510)